MRTIAILFALFALAACEPTSAPRPAPEEATNQSGSGVNVSGYARVGVSTEF